MRVYLPATSTVLAALASGGVLGPAPLTGFAVTPGLREYYLDDDMEALEYAAAAEAARAALRLIAADPGAAKRRLVVSADVPEGSVSVRDDLDRGVVRVAVEIPLAWCASVHADDAEAERTVAAAAEQIDAADLGDPAAEEVVDDAEGFELSWYATQEIEDLLCASCADSRASYRYLHGEAVRCARAKSVGDQQPATRHGDGIRCGPMRMPSRSPSARVGCSSRPVRRRRTATAGPRKVIASSSERAVAITAAGWLAASSVNQLPLAVSSNCSASSTSTTCPVKESRCAVRSAGEPGVRTSMPCPLAHRASSDRGGAATSMANPACSAWRAITTAVVLRPLRRRAGDQKTWCGRRTVSAQTGWASSPPTPRRQSPDRPVGSWQVEVAVAELCSADRQFCLAHRSSASSDPDGRPCGRGTECAVPSRCDGCLLGPGGGVTGEQRQLDFQAVVGAYRPAQVRTEPGGWPHSARRLRSHCDRSGRVAACGSAQGRSAVPASLCRRR